MKNLLFIFGTRPEAIKLSPLIIKCQELPEKFNVKVCVTGQHKEMLSQVLDFFEINPSIDLAGMKQNQTLFDITANTLTGLEPVLEGSHTDYVIVQGDTTSAFIGALAAFYKQIKVVHLEAGLRSGNMFSPFPEEANRSLVGRLADIHFTPTSKATENLKNEGTTEGVFEVGNTVIDALLMTRDRVELNEAEYSAKFDHIDFTYRSVLITGHRRESFGKPFEEMCEAIKELAFRYPSSNFIYPVHLNPNVRKKVFGILDDVNNVFLIDPVDYPTLIWLLNKSHLVLTDSGGIQEEAPTLGKPVLVMRDVTERTEGIEAGTARLVGTDRNNIIDSVTLLMEDDDAYKAMARAVNPYGDGTTCEKVIEILQRSERIG